MLEDGILDTGFGLGDILGFGLGSYGAVGIAEHATTTVEGTSLSDNALTMFGLGSDIHASFSVLLFLAGILIAYTTNDGLSVDSLLNRPKWEILTVVTGVSIPVIAEYGMFGYQSWVDSGIGHRAVVSGVLLACLIIVGYRTHNDKKESMWNRGKNIAGKFGQ